MAVRTDFAAGEVLAAQDLDDTFAAKVNYALPVNAQTGSGASAYTFVLADALRLTTASNASAGTYTIPPQSSVVWLANSVIRIVNYGAGTVTIAGGAGVTVTNATTTLAQFESAALIRTASNAWTLVPFSGGAGNADFSNTATGTYTSGGINYKYVRFTSNGTLTITKAGVAEILVVAGGSSGGGEFAALGGGRGGGITYGLVTLAATTHTVVIGAGGSPGGLTNTADSGNIGGDSRLGNFGAARGVNYGTAGFNAPLVSSITNTSVTYGQTAQNPPAANTGSGGSQAGCCGAPPGNNGAAGVVIVRVIV